MKRRSSSRERLEAALNRIEDPAGEGSRACLTVYADGARAAADASDERVRAGASLSPFDGVIITIKDLFDIAGETTRAGSRVLVEEGAPAKQDAEVIRRLKRAGAVIVAKSNMSEFAFHGIGTNPHYGTPGNPQDRLRVPGGSTSGGAVAVADGMCEIAIGTDTGGSTRAPAALCGIVGWKPSCQRLPTDGAFPLSTSLDSIGSMARSVADCALSDAIMAGIKPVTIRDATLSDCRLLVFEGLPLSGLDPVVSAAWDECVALLTRAGARLQTDRSNLLDRMVSANAIGGVVPAEAFRLHGDRIDRRPHDIDRNVLARIERGRTISEADYAKMMQMRRELVKAMDQNLAAADAIIMPTSPFVAPLIKEIESPDSFAVKNMAVLRNTSIMNFFDLCAVSLPMPRTSGLPTGLMIAGRNGSDERLFAIAAAVERLFASPPMVETSSAAMAR